MVIQPKRRLSARVLKVSLTVAAVSVLFFGIMIFVIEFEGGVRDARAKLLTDIDDLVTTFTREVKRREARVRLLFENPQAMSAAVQSLEHTRNPELFFGSGVLYYEILHLSKIEKGGPTQSEFESLVTGPREGVLKIVDLSDPNASAGLLYEVYSIADNKPISVRILWNLDSLIPPHDSIRDHLCEGTGVSNESGKIIWQSGTWSAPGEMVDHTQATRDVESDGRGWIIVSRELAAFSEPAWIHAVAPKSVLYGHAWATSRAILIRTLSLLAVGLSLVLMMAIWIRQVMKPLEDITRGVQQIAGGDLETVLETAGEDDLAFLAETVNDMTHRLKVKEQSVQAHIQLLKEKNTELEDLGEKLRQADRLKDHFLAVLSHELRTPLTAILGYSELMVEGIYGPLPDKQREIVVYVHNNGTKLLAIMEDLLDVAKIRSGTIEINDEPFRLKDLIAEIRKFAENSIRSRPDVRYEEEIEAGVEEEFHSDMVKIEQILTNLISNAAKFTERGFVRLKVRPAGRGWVEFEVEDSGIGIAEQHLPKIFAPFVQLDAGIRRRYGGTGLGLTISRSLAEKMGGRISVESELGNGSRFRVTLPTVYKVAEDIHPVQSPTATEVKNPAT